MNDFTSSSFYGEDSQDLRGPKGDKGDTGAQGDLGPQGVKGDQGIAGPQANDGADGSNGIDGKNAVYRFGTFAAQGIQENEILLDHVVATACSLGDQFAGSFASVGTPPSEIWKALVSLNDAPIGTLELWPNGSAFLASPRTGPIPLAQGDVVSLTAPEDPDLSIRRVRVTFTGEL